MFNYTAIITTYNSERTIAGAIMSISNQDIVPAEVILIDDQSNDRTVRLAQEFHNKVKNFQIVVNASNLGQSAGRNIGANLASSEYLVFFDDDDISFESRSKAHAAHFALGADVSFVSSTKNYPNGYSVKCLNKDLTLNPNTTDLVKYLLLGLESLSIKDVFVPASTCGISKDAFHKIGGYDVNFRRLEDVDLAIKSSIGGLKFSWTSEIEVARAFSENSTKGSGIDMMFEEKLLHKYRKFLEPDEFVNALIHAKTRKLYFSKSYIKLILHLVCNPVYSALYLSRIRKFLTRIVHDLRKS
jgi:glycosyltransferase involved in cell wall biosynthesis